MKTFAQLLLAMAFFLCCAVASAQEGDAPQPSTDNPQVAADTMGTALEYEFTKDFDVVFKAVKQGLEKAGYEVAYSSKKRLLIETAYKKFATEDDDFYEVMSVYGDVPYIRSPGWTVGRGKINVTFEQFEGNRVAVRVLAVLSGYEKRFTNQWHYWKSNGKLEEEALAAIVEAVDAVKEP